MKIVINYCIFIILFSILNNHVSNAGKGTAFLAPTLSSIFEVFIKSFTQFSNVPFQNQLNSSQYNLVQDGFLTTPQLIKKYGYPVETHSVVTEDGYILTLYRIPKIGGIPVYLQHGFLDSSAAWVYQGPHKSLAYILSDLGYDIWLGNSRGNRYSKRHVSLCVNSRKFWDFSFHEMGVFDLPATIDYISNTTAFPKIHYMGHSQGTTSFFIMGSLKPSYNKKILLMTALSPIAYFEHIESPIIQGLFASMDSIDLVFKLFQIYDILPNNDAQRITAQVLCNKKAKTQNLCKNLIFLVIGYDSEQLDEDFLPILVSHLPAGAAEKQFLHFGQLKKSNRFRMYDYGMFRNLKTYGTLKPPDYNVSRITAPIAAYYSVNDWLANTRDVERFLKQLPNIVHVNRIPYKKFNHLDFTIAKDAKILLYDDVIKTMKLMENKK